MLKKIKTKCRCAERRKVIRRRYQTSTTYLINKMVIEARAAPFSNKQNIFNQTYIFLRTNNIFEKYKSGFRVNHRTETPLLKIINDLRYQIESQNVQS